MTTDQLKQLLDKMWKDYVDLNPQAQKIVNLIEERGDKVVNDHIALRTFDHPRLGIDVLAKPFIDAGYVEAGDYHFEQKKLYAKHYEHKDPQFPTLFISELQLEKFSQNFQDKVSSLIDQVKDSDIANAFFSSNGRPWNLSSSDYFSLKEESDYGAWLSAIGYRPNHFTVFVNALKSFTGLEDLNLFLKEKGFELNDSAGEIKGSPSELLEQSSTLADKVRVDFSDTSLEIASCYFEFARRYPQDNGELYMGFIAKSADKIFESTDRTQS